jgi:hypothetical protein
MLSLKRLAIKFERGEVSPRQKSLSRAGWAARRRRRGLLGMRSAISWSWSACSRANGSGGLLVECIALQAVAGSAEQGANAADAGGDDEVFYLHQILPGPGSLFHLKADDCCTSATTSDSNPGLLMGKEARLARETRPSAPGPFKAGSRAHPCLVGRQRPSALAHEPDCHRRHRWRRSC